MILKGKAKEDFEKYWERLPRAEKLIKYKKGKDSIDFSWSVNDFFDLPFSMQYGVIVDFFDSVGIYIGLKTIPSSNLPFDYNIKGEYGEWIFTEYDYSKTRTEARQKAIEKAVEIYNNTK